MTLSKTERNRRWLKANPHKVREYELRSRYGISSEEYDRLLQEQGGACAICAGSCPTGRRLAVDHDHETGRVRGLLCATCNQRLAWFEQYGAIAEEYLQ